MEDLRLAAGDDGLPQALLNGSEAYLETWERAYGVKPSKCRSPKARITRRGLGPLRLGRSAFATLKKGGQPAKRRGNAYLYCVRGEKRPGVVVFFKRNGRKALLVAGDGKRFSAGGVRVGAPVSALRGKARHLGGSNIWLERKKGKRRFLYVVRNHRVRVVGTAARGFLGTLAAEREVAARLPIG
jgi:hypothetical protein